MVKSSCEDYKGIINLPGLGVKMSIKGSKHISQDTCYCLEILGCNSTKLKEWKIRIKKSGNYLEIFVY